MAKPLIPVKDLAVFMNEALPQAVTKRDLIVDTNGAEPGGDGYIETWSETPITELDVSNISDFGQAYEDLDQESQMKFKENLITLVTKQVFVAKEYTKWGIDITRSFDSGNGVLQKIRMPLQYDAEDSTSVFENPQDYLQHFVDFEVTSKYFYKPATKRLTVTISDNILRGLFLSMDNASKFIAMIWNSVNNTMAIHLDTLSMAVINTATAAVLKQGQVTQKYNLLEMYNTFAGNTLTVEQALRDAGFHKYAKSIIMRTKDMMSAPSGLYNMARIVSQTTDRDSYFWTLSDFTRTADEYLLSDTYHKDLVKIPNSTSVNRWQGTGEDGSFGEVSKISIKTTFPGSTVPETFEQDGIIAIIANKDAVAITDIEESTTSEYKAKDRYTAFYPQHVSKSQIDLDEDYVVFYMAE